MKKRGFLSHVTNLILAAIVILVIIVIVAKFMQGLGGNEFHPGSEMTLERVKEQIDILMDSEEAFAETTLRFSIHEDYLFMAGDKSSIKGMPLIQAMLENIPNQYAAYNHAEPKCKDRSCVCILNQDNKPLCKSFLNEITFVGEEGKNPRSPPYLGSQIRGSPNGNVALAKFNLTTLYVAKIVIDDEAANAVVAISLGDMRKALTALQVAAAIDGHVTRNMIYETTATAPPEALQQYLLACREDGFHAARRRLRELLDKFGLAGTDFVNQLHRELYNTDFLSELAKLDLTELMAEIDFRLVEGGGEQLQLDAMTARICQALTQ